MTQLNERLLRSWVEKLMNLCGLLGTSLSFLTNIFFFVLLLINFHLVEFYVKRICSAT